MQLSLPLVEDEPPPRFVRHRRARRYILRVMEDGSLRVTLPRWGSKREALAFVEASRGWIVQQREHRRRHVQTRVDATPEMRAQAREQLPRELEALAVRHGIAVRRVSIRNQRSRWGSCSRSGSITLNWRLILMPEFVREYVMLHELMHRRELNHSPRFWRHVAAACPRMIEARRWLRTEGQRLF